MNAPLKHDTRAVRLPTPFGLNDTQREVLEAIRAFPGLTYKEYAEMLVLPKRKGLAGPEMLVRQVVAWLRRRELVNLGYKKPTPPNFRPERLVFPVTPSIPFDPAAGLEQRKVKRKDAVPAPSAGSAIIYAPMKDKQAEAWDEAIMAELEDLRAFKKMALGRYPDLAVPDVLLRARKLAAAQFTDIAAKTAIFGGQKDGSPMMRAIVAALEGGA
jgi:hypothetical protein